MRHHDWPPPKVVHLPFCPPRQNTPGEVIYLKLWQAWATENPDDWASIFSDMHSAPRQRVACCAASFMVHMGTNDGASFTHQCTVAAKGKTFPHTEYVKIWASHNVRHAGVNHGLRCIEYMLAREYPIQRAFVGRCINWQKVPNITMEDMDAIECMVAWWSTEPAIQMRQMAEPLIRMAQHQLLKGNMTWNISIP